MPPISRFVARPLQPSLPALNTARPAPAIFANYAKRDLPLVLDAARRVPPTNPAVIGTYGINKEESDAVHSLPNGRYAPIFVLVREKAPRRFEGIPPLKDLNTWREGFEAGREVGLRMRDQIEAAKANGVQIDSWQLDELWLAERGNVGQMKRMWNTFDRASLGVLGEEYPPFRGDPAVAAGKHAHGVDLVRGYGPSGANVASKYIPLLTPGFRGGAALGGRQPGQTEADAFDWQDRYTNLRTARGAAGIGFFGLVRGKDGRIGDADPEVLRMLAEDVRRTLRTINAR